MKFICSFIFALALSLNAATTSPPPVVATTSGGQSFAVPLRGVAGIGGAIAAINDQGRVTVPAAGVTNIGIVGRIFADDFERATLGAKWKVFYGSAAYITNSHQLYIGGGPMVVLTNGMTASMNWEIRWSETNAAFNGTSSGAGVGVMGALGLGYYGWFLGDTGADSRKLQIWQYNTNNGGFSKVAESFAIAGAYAPTDWIDLRFARTNDTLTLTGTNRTTGLGQKVSATFVYTGSGNVSPGIQQVSSICGQGGTFIESIVMTNTAPSPVDLLILSDSIYDGWNAGSFGAGPLGRLMANCQFSIAGYMSPGAGAVSMVQCTNEILAYHAKDILMVIGGNDIASGDTLAHTKAYHTKMSDIFTASGSRVTVGLPTARTASDLSVWKNWLVSRYRGHYIDLWTVTSNGGTGLLPAYSGDGETGVHLNALGASVVYQTIAHSPLIAGKMTIHNSSLVNSNSSLNRSR
jgi:hypothetical protein